MLFQALAYQFYPKGVFQNNNPLLRTSSEYFRLQQRRQESIEKNSKNWALLVKKVEEYFGKAKVDNFDYYLPDNEKSFPICISVATDGNQKTKNLVLHISTLIDSFVIYQTDPNIASYVSPKEYASFNIESRLEPAYTELKKITSQYFPLFSEFQKDLLNVEIPDIMDDGIGIFDDNTLNILPELRTKMTVYHVFFSNQYYFNLRQ